MSRKASKETSWPVFLSCFTPRSTRETAEVWVVLLDDNGSRVVTIQEKRDTTPPTWPSEDVPMQMHMDSKVPTVEDLERTREHAEELGARLLYDRSEDEGEPLYVMAEPAGHPFCLLVQ